jgi:aminoglycoside phosphotransferase (APT) family kinase protein
MIDTEPQLAVLLEERKARREAAAYIPQEDASIAALLQGWFKKVEPNAVVNSVARMGGGASKEQFVFTLSQSGEKRQFVLRMDPLEAITETSRQREFEILKAMRDIIPVPDPVWLDAEGAHFPRPAVIMDFIGGVIKPKSDGVTVTGLGTVLGDPLRGTIRPQFVEVLARVHNFDWAEANLPSFAVPASDAKQATRWLIEFWKELYEQDVVTNEPVMRLATQWLQNNIPDCDKISVVHGDYRTGNYLFEEENGRLTAVLDWEMSHLGDYHEDLAWAMQPVFGTNIEGIFRGSDIAKPNEFYSDYTALSGNPVDPVRLHYFIIFNAWKSYILVSALGVTAARHAHNHQDVLLTFLAGTGPLFIYELARLLQMEESQ